LFKGAEGDMGTFARSGGLNSLSAGQGRARKAPWDCPVMLEIAAFFVLAVWLYLLAGRGGFWRAAERDDRPAPPAPAAWPPIVAVIPARDEAASIGQTVQSLLGQDYPGLEAIVVDDGSQDGTASVAAAAAKAVDASERLTVLTGRPLPPGWTGKLWAVKQGVEAASVRRPTYLLLTDADIVYDAGALKRLVARAEQQQTVLTSIMVKLRCESLAEHYMIPAFVFFFQMLYPFAWVNRRQSATAAAAGGCMLVHSDALAASGGIDGIRNALIDDCALAKQMKAVGPIWLGLSEHISSIRAYDTFGPIRRMVTRSAYAELRYSPLRLIGTTLGMALVFLVAPLLAIFTTGTAAWLGAAAWALMIVAYWPTLRLYRLSPLWGVALPAIAFIYTLWTVESALQYARGRGGQWKGRVQAIQRGAR
jgi:hopene-associated glycosyltransferase HpnB